MKRFLLATMFRTLLTPFMQANIDDSDVAVTEPWNLTVGPHPHQLSIFHAAIKLEFNSKVLFPGMIMLAAIDFRRGECNWLMFL
jgi:hypothetical protein